MRYGTEFHSRTVASLKPEISQAKNSLLDEIASTDEAQVIHAETTSLRETVTDDHLDPPRSNLDLLACAKSYVRSLSNQAVLIVAYSASVGSSLNEIETTCPKQGK